MVENVLSICCYLGNKMFLGKNVQPNDGQYFREPEKACGESVMVDLDAQETGAQGWERLLRYPHTACPKLE